jgi:hypothetical protein
VFSRERSEADRRRAGAVQEDRRQASREVLGVGTLACPQCDAPVGIGPERLAPGSPLTCPFCGHHEPLRAFLSLTPPTRPTRVIVRVTAPARLRTSAAD